MLMSLDLRLFLFDSRNYYTDCIRMDENHILCAEEKISAAGIDFGVRIIRRPLRQFFMRLWRFQSSIPHVGGNRERCIRNVMFQWGL